MGISTVLFIGRGLFCWRTRRGKGLKGKSIRVIFSIILFLLCIEPGYQSRFP